MVPAAARQAGQPYSRCIDDQIRRGAHRSVRELEAAIASYIDARNADPKPFRWFKSADDILADIERFCQRTNAVHGQTA